MSRYENDCSLPCHPFFETAIDQASFTDCINAIDRVRAMIALCDAITFDEEHGGISSDAAYGFYWVTAMTRSALSYVSNRLIKLNRENNDRHEQESAYLSALLNALPNLNHECHEDLLNCTATQLEVSRLDVDRFIERQCSLQAGLPDVGPRASTSRHCR